MPPSIHIKNYGETAGRWMENTLRVIGAEAGRGQMGSDLIALRLSEIIFVQALRSYIETEGAERPVWAGFSDRNIARALKAIHHSPGFAWTLEDLAQIAGMSRTSFVTRFSQCVSMTPLGYITYWRMQIARQLLAVSGASIIDVAERVGYQSEAAFSRVFKKQRMEFLAFNRSFAGDENRDIESAFDDELPGQLGWALDGWDRLRKQGDFTKSETSAKRREHMENLSSRTRPFIDECCELVPDAVTPKRDLWRAFQRYAETNDVTRYSTAAMFHEDLHMGADYAIEDADKGKSWKGIELKHAP